MFPSSPLNPSRSKQWSPRFIQPSGSKLLQFSLFSTVTPIFPCPFSSFKWPLEPLERFSLTTSSSSFPHYLSPSFSLFRALPTKGKVSLLSIISHPVRLQAPRQQALVWLIYHCIRWLEQWVAYSKSSVNIYSMNGLWRKLSRLWYVQSK